MKQFIISFLFLLFTLTIFGQSPVGLGKISSNKIKLATHVIEQDSALSTWPLLLSVKQENKFSKPVVTESYKSYSVNFFPEKESGIVYLELQNLAQSVKPELYIQNQKGEILYKTKAISSIIAVNLREVSPGSYFVTSDINGEVLTWEVVKE